MLDKLEALVFGFDEFEKAKIDERFNQILVILNELNIKEIRDFEILEKVIFKIKELLRVKSSNLNSIIRNPKKKLTKKQVLEIVEELDKLKYNFLKKAFSAIKKEESKEELKVEDNKQKKVEEFLSNLEIISNDNVKVSIENGKVPYILLNFKESVDFVLVKNLSSLFFEVYNCHGTNILIHENRVLIIPRFESDNLLSLPQVQVDLDEVYSLLNQNNENVERKDKVQNSNDFVEVNENQVRRPKTREKQDDSLDALLSNSKDTTFTKKPDPLKDSSKIEVEKDDSIEVKIDESKEIEIEKRNKREVNGDENEKKKIINEVKTSKEVSSKSFEIFRDDKIVVYLKEDSKVSGELIIENIFGKKLNEVEDSILTYMLMFSKVFGAVLFETKESHGTNIIYDFNDSKIRIVPRYQNDEMPLNWNLKQATDEELDEVREKLIKAMSSAMNGEKKEVGDGRKESREEPKVQEEKSDVKKKAEHILQSLTRIP